MRDQKGAMGDSSSSSCCSSSKVAMKKANTWKRRRSNKQHTFLSFFSSLYYYIVGTYRCRIFLSSEKHEEKRERKWKNTIKNYHSNRGVELSWADGRHQHETRIDSSIQKCFVYKRVVINTSLLEAEQQQPALAFITYNFTFVCSLVRQRYTQQTLWLRWVQISALTIYITLRWQDWRQMLLLQPITVSCAQ